jgi:hypothetical protein
MCSGDKVCVFFLDSQALSKNALLLAMCGAVGCFLIYLFSCKYGKYKPSQLAFGTTLKLPCFVADSAMLRRLIPRMSPQGMQP